MGTAHPLSERARRKGLAGIAAQAAAACAATALVIASAVLTRQHHARARLAPMAVFQEPGAAAAPETPHVLQTPVPLAWADDSAADAAPPALSHESLAPNPHHHPDTRWFDARPARPARTVWMTVTGYSPDERSCGKWADGMTCSMHSVWTNAMRLAAADPAVLPLGSIVSVPGYDDARIIPILDKGGAIKGMKLDLLFATHDEARRWGKRRLPVTIWEFTDGQPADWRRARDSR